MPSRSASRPAFWLVLALTVLGLLRAGFLWSHDPLYAYANTFDQVRYTACFDIYPDRHPAIPPDENSPDAPFEWFRFASARAPMCYWSSELMFTAITAAIWRLDERFNADRVHSVRVIGALKLATLLVLSWALSLAWLRRGRDAVAIAHASVLLVLFADPGNTLYVNTFYAEWTALLSAYALFAMLAVWHGEAATRVRFVAIAAVALLLATSKMQHLLLPLALAITLLIVQRWSSGRVRWQAGALLLGALLGLFFQFVQIQRTVPMMDSIRQFNRAHVVFTALLPVAADQRAFLEQIGVDADCVKYSGKHAWEMPGLPDSLCPGVLEFGYADQLRVLLTEPLMTLKLARAAVISLDAWTAENIGQVEAAVRAEIPRSVPTLGVPLRRWPPLQFALLALPVVGLVVLLACGGVRRFAGATEFSALIVVLMLATLTITVLGDGLADTAKQGHLVLNAAIAWLIVAISALGAWLWRGDQAARAGVTTSASWSHRAR